jgi:hypothetical protein
MSIRHTPSMALSRWRTTAGLYSSIRFELGRGGLLPLRVGNFSDVACTLNAVQNKAGYYLAIFRFASASPAKPNALAGFGLPLQNLASASLLSCVSVYYLPFRTAPSQALPPHLHTPPHAPSRCSIPQRGAVPALRYTLLPPRVGRAGHPVGVFDELDYRGALHVLAGAPGSQPRPAARDGGRPSAAAVHAIALLRHGLRGTRRIREVRRVSNPEAWGHQHSLARLFASVQRSFSTAPRGAGRAPNA